MNLDISLGEVILAGMIGVGVVSVWLMNRKDGNGYNVIDMLLGPDGKASLDKHILLGMALLAGWCVVKQAVAKQPVETLLLGVLTVFVVQRGVRDGIAAFTKGDKDVDPGTGVK